MPETIELQASDGHTLSACLERPAGSPRGGLVVIQEVFGVNAHVRRVVARFAEAGYLSLAPCLFDRIEPGLELGYDDAGIARGREGVAQLGWDAPLRDVLAAADWAETQDLKVAVVGYCWGGTVACLCATRLGLPAVSYYGARTVPFLHERPQAPLLMHFGEHDALFPPEQVDRVRKAWPAADIHLYDAGHGFNCDERADYRPDSAALALERSLAFLDRVLAK
ncbi:MAG TPA: dienelactone hydrolase family protein [Xanthomonadaceae bacterium]|nr:dienelactone hydrolase family protein [Xanthomonadaceae bacterium]